MCSWSVVTHHKGFQITPALTEVAGNTGLSFPVRNASALSSRLQELASSAALRNDLIAAGSQRAEQFTWDRWGATAAEITMNYLRH